MHWIIKAAIAFWAADEVVKGRTGKRIHQHAFEWWAGFRDRIIAWAHANGHVRTHKFVMLIDEAISTAISLGKRIRAKVVATSPTGQQTVVTDEEVPPEELAEVIPRTRQHQAVDITALVQ